tara:strand:+ start:14939 stop:15307 length:369 start_codon:yes stop_codon:yes gene_type:complete
MTYSLLKSFLACILILAFTACNNNDSIKAKIVNSSKNDIEINLKYPKQIIMNIEGMTCAIGCAATIEKNLNKTAGVKSAIVNFKTKKATLIFDADILNPNDITQIVLNTSNNYSVSDLEFID